MERDNAPRNKYKALRNKVSSMVRRDKLRHNWNTLKCSGNDPKVLWGLANAAVGKNRPTLPASLEVNGVSTVGNLEAADAMNAYYIKKIDDLRDELTDCPPPPTSSWPEQSRDFSWKFPNAGRISRIVGDLGSTEALGIDGIPVSVLKKGVSVLASPIAFLVQRSLASGIVPSGFKKGIITPIYKGGGK